MKAIVLTRYGPPDVLELQEVGKPAPGDDEVLVKVRASAVNDWDWCFVRGKPLIYRLLFGLFRPKVRVLGAEVAGTVETVGKDVTRFRPGDDVYGDVSDSGFGGFAEYVCVREDALARKPPDMVLGTDHTGSAIRVLAQVLNAGLGFFGNTGAGKTGLLLFVLPQLVAAGVKIWLSEMYKRDLRQVRVLLEAIGEELIILRARDWKSNILQAGANDPHAHLAVIVGVLVRVLGLPPRASIILRQVCHALYREFGVWDGRTEAWPCLYDVYERIRSAQGLNPPAREAILDRLGSLLTALGPDCAAYRLAWTADDLAQYSIDFEMTGASPAVQELLLFSTLFSLLQREVERGFVNQRMSLFTVFEDGQRLFDMSQHTGGDVAPMDELAGVIRGTAKGVGVIVQTREGFSKRLLPNLANKMFGRLGSNDDLRKLGADLGMNTAQIDFARSHLRPGVYVAQLADADWREPFLLRTPKVEVPRRVSDDEAARSVQALDHLPVKPAEEYRHWQPYEAITLTRPAAKEQQPPDRRQAKTAAEDSNETGAALDDTALCFLDAVVRHPGRKSSEYARLAGINAERAVAVRRALVEQGYLREHRVATGGRGRAAIVLQPLRPAYDAVSGLKE